MARYFRHRDAADHKAAKRVDPFAEALDPIREAYHRTNAKGREAILALVIRRITSPLPRSRK